MVQSKPTNFRQLLCTFGRLLSQKIHRFYPFLRRHVLRHTQQPSHRNIINTKLATTLYVHKRFEFRKCKSCLQITEYVRYIQQNQHQINAKANCRHRSWVRAYTLSLSLLQLPLHYIGMVAQIDSLQREYLIELLYIYHV